MLNIVIFGPPGAGKGTQSAKLVEKYQFIHLSTGDILRGEITAGTILGQEAKILMDQGMLVPDDMVITMIKNKIEKNATAKGFIFDGFPRTTTQAQALDKLLAARGTGITLTLALEVSTEELTKRILQRGLESGRTDDIDEKTIRNRVNEYANKTAPLKDYYSNQRKLRTVSGIGTVDDIFNALCSKIDSVYVNEYSTSGIPEEEHVIQTPATITQHSYREIAPVQQLVDEPVQEKKAEKVANITVAKKAAKPLVKKKSATKKVAKKKPAKKKAAVKKTIQKKVSNKKPAKKLAKKKTAKKKSAPKNKKAVKKKKSRR